MHIININPELYALIREQNIIEIVHKRRRSFPREDVRKLKVSLDNEFKRPNLKSVEILYSISLENTICLHIERKLVLEQPILIVVFINIITL